MAAKRTDGVDWIREMGYDIRLADEKYGEGWLNRPAPARRWCRHDVVAAALLVQPPHDRRQEDTERAGADDIELI